MTALTAKTTSEFLTFVQNGAANRLDDMTEDQFVSYLNEALQTRYNDLIRIVPSVYSQKTSVSPSGAYSVTVPTNFKPDQTLQLFWDENIETYDALLPSDEAWLDGGTIRFSGKVNDTYYLRYTARESYYSKGDTIAETVDSQALHLLASEIKALYYDAENENRATDSSVNALTKANRKA